MIKLLSKPNVDGASANYPFGKIRDKTTSTNGTPVNTVVYGDIHQFFEQLMNGAGVVPNDLPDNTTNGFQLFEAFLRYANNGIKTVTLSANTSETLVKDDAGKVVKVTIGSGVTFTYTVTLPSATTVKAGQGYLFYITDSDDSITSVVVNGQTYYNNEVVFVVSNGTTWDNVVYQFSGKTKRIAAVTEDMGGGLTRIRLNSITNFYFFTPSHSIANVAEIRLLGDVAPRQGQRFSLVVNSDGVISEAGNIRILNNGTTDGTLIGMQIRTNDILNFVYGVNNDARWYVTNQSPTYGAIYNITPQADVSLSAGVRSNVLNWLQLLVNKVQTAITNIAAVTTTANDAMPKAGGTFTGQVIGAGGATGNQLVTFNDVANLINTQGYNITVSSGNVTKSSASGVITTFTAGFCSYTQVGKVATINIVLQIDLSNNWLAGDYLEIDLSSIETPSGAGAWHGVANAFPDGGALTFGGLVARVNNSWGKKLRIVFLTANNDPTGVNSCINASISYIVV